MNSGLRVLQAGSEKKAISVLRASASYEAIDVDATDSDSRAVRVFGENTKSGRLINRGNLQDLVNRGYRIGNSWPVLNAGAQLPTDKYFFEVQQGKTTAYEGEVVVYDSFVVRMR